MHCFEGDSLDALYLEALSAVRDKGVEITKGGRAIRELYNVTFHFTAPRKGILCVEGRPYNPAFAVAEMLWNLNGDIDDWLCAYNAKYAEYFTEGRLTAGYGARLMGWSGGTNQVRKAVELLRRTPQSQHANLLIFDPATDLDEPKFVPCITMIKLRIREGRLHFSSFLRAQDMWLGFPYDVFLLLNLFQLLAIELEVEMGDYHHYCDVIRLYEANFEEAERPLTIGPPDADRRIDLGFGRGQIWEQLRLYRDLVRNPPADMLTVAEAQPPYWRDCLLACLAYSRLRQGAIQDAAGIVRKIGNAFSEQASFWSLRYWPSLHANLAPEGQS
jgi:thymidylate synthase